MIDISKMKALAARLRGPINKFDNTAAAYSESAQTIEDLLSELEAAKAANDGPGSPSHRLGRLLDALDERFPGVVDSLGSRGPEPLLLAAIDKLRAELEAREADRRRLGLELEGVIIDTEQGYGFDEVCLATIKRVRAALAQRQEGEEK